MDTDVVLSSSWVWMSLFPWVAAQATQIGSCPSSSRLQTPSWPLTLGVCMTFGFTQAFQRGRTPTKEWLRLQISLLGFILSPHPQKGLSGRESLLSLQLGAQMSPPISLPLLCTGQCLGCPNL